MAKKPKVILPKRLVAVSWRDAYYDDDIHTEEQLATEDKTCIIHSVGFVANETDEVITIGMDFCPYGGHYRHVCRIRKENIQQIHQIAGGSD